MDINQILQVVAVVTDMFAPAIQVLVGVGIAAVGIKWVLRIFMR